MLRHVLQSDFTFAFNSFSWKKIIEPYIQWVRCLTLLIFKSNAVNFSADFGQRAALSAARLAPNLEMIFYLLLFFVVQTAAVEEDGKLVRSVHGERQSKKPTNQLGEFIPLARRTWTRLWLFGNQLASQFRVTSLRTPASCYCCERRVKTRRLTRFCDLWAPQSQIDVKKACNFLHFILQKEIMT